MSNPLYQLIQKVMRLVDTIGVEKTLSHINTIDTEQTDLIKLEKQILLFLGVQLKDMQTQNIRTDERHLALLVYTKFAKEEIKITPISIAYNLKKNARTINRYASTYKDYESDIIPIAKEFNKVYGQILMNLKN